MSIDLSKIKGISDEVKELSGGGDDCACDSPGWFTPECPTFICVSDFVCCPIDK